MGPNQRMLMESPPITTPLLITTHTRNKTSHTLFTPRHTATSPTAIRTNHKIVRTTHRTIRTNHKTIRIHHKAIKICHKTIRSSYKMINTNHKTITSSHKTFTSSHKTIKTRHKTTKMIRTNHIPNTANIPRIMGATPNPLLPTNSRASQSTETPHPPGHPPHLTTQTTIPQQLTTIPQQLTTIPQQLKIIPKLVPVTKITLLMLLLTFHTPIPERLRLSPNQKIHFETYKDFCLISIKRKEIVVGLKGNKKEKRKRKRKKGGGGE
jgi:hypothetical protein